MAAIYGNPLTIADFVDAQSCPTPCDPMGCNPPGSSILGVLQTRTLEWVAISFSRGFSQHRDQTCVSCLTGGFFTNEPPGKPLAGLLAGHRGFKYQEKKEKGKVGRGVRSCDQVGVGGTNSMMLPHFPRVASQGRPVSSFWSM